MYNRYNNYLKTINDENDFLNFKSSENLTYMTEHRNYRKYGAKWLIHINKLNMISNNELSELLLLNDKYGNPEKFQFDSSLPNCSSNSLKYVYFGLLIAKDIINKNLNDIDIIEIGGGYGGQCIILQKILSLLDIKINKYCLIDLENVVDFQKKYISKHNMSEKCVFLTSERYKDYKFNTSSYLLSSYSLSEIPKTYRQNYYDNLFKYVYYGFIVWNFTSKDNKGIDLPSIFQKTVINEDPQTFPRKPNKFVYFHR